MIRILVPASESWDEEKEEFIYTREQTLSLEHSLVSVSKWESKWNKPFLHSDKTPEETVDYIRCMTLTQNVDPRIYYSLTSENLDTITDYIAAPMTATTFSDDKKAAKNRDIITSEVLYYSMIALNIPFECQKWHLNRLLTLIQVCNIKNQPPQKRGTNDILRSNAKLNAARRKQFNTKG